MQFPLRQNKAWRHIVSFCIKHVAKTVQHKFVDECGVKTLLLTAQPANPFYGPEAYLEPYRSLSISKLFYKDGKGRGDVEGFVMNSHKVLLGLLGRGRGGAVRYKCNINTVLHYNNQLLSRMSRTTQPMYFVFFRLYPSFPQPPWQFLAPT